MCAFVGDRRPALVRSRRARRASSGRPCRRARAASAPPPVDASPFGKSARRAHPSHGRDGGFQETTSTGLSCPGIAQDWMSLDTSSCSARSSASPASGAIRSPRHRRAGRAWCSEHRRSAPPWSAASRRCRSAALRKSLRRTSSAGCWRRCSPCSFSGSGRLGASVLVCRAHDERIGGASGVDHAPGTRTDTLRSGEHPHQHMSVDQDHPFEASHSTSIGSTRSSSISMRPAYNPHSEERFER